MVVSIFGGHPMSDTIAVIGAYSHYPDFAHLAYALAFAGVTGALLWIATAALVSAARGGR